MELLFTMTGILAFGLFMYLLSILFQGEWR